MKQALHEIPKTLSKTRNPSLTLPPAEEIEEESDNSQGEGIKITIPSYIIEFCTRVEVLLQWKLSGHTDAVTDVSNLIDEIYKRSEKYIEQQYPRALDNFYIK